MSEDQKNLFLAMGLSLLVIAGGVLIAYSLLAIGLALYGERSVQPEALLQKLFAFVSQFPTLLLGFSLLFFGRERLADRAGWNWSLLRMVPLVLLLLYLAAIPTAGVLLQGIKDRLDTRLQNVLQAGRTRGAQIEADLAKLKSSPSMLAVLRTYPEISNIDLPGESTPDQVRSVVATAIRQGLDVQDPGTQGNRRCDEGPGSPGAVDHGQCGPCLDRLPAGECQVAALG